MLDTLGEELLGRVLALLPGADLKSARQAARILDEASLTHTGRAAALTLAPATAGGALGGPTLGALPAAAAPGAARLAVV